MPEAEEKACATDMWRRTIWAKADERSGFASSMNVVRELVEVMARVGRGREADAATVVVGKGLPDTVIDPNGCPNQTHVQDFYFFRNIARKSALLFGAASPLEAACAPAALVDGAFACV